MVHSVFELGDTLVREVMVPRTDLVSIERYKTIRQALTLALRSGFSRIPVTGDSEDDVVGIVYLKDLARKTHISREAESELVSTAMRPAFFVPDTKNAGDLLREMQKQRNHVAVVIDEYGGTAGIVTIEDILEEIVGEITDEYDRELPPVQELGEDRFRVTARLDIGDLGELYGLEAFDDEDVETVGGLLAKALGRVPIAGASSVVELPDGRELRLTAEAAAGRRNKIVTVLAEPVAPARASGRPGRSDPAAAARPVPVVRRGDGGLPVRPGVLRVPGAGQDVRADAPGRAAPEGQPQVRPGRRGPAAPRARGLIVPGWHMNKRHWNTVTVDGGLPDRLVRELVEDSYDLVVAGLPRADRLRLDRP